MKYYSGSYSIIQYCPSPSRKEVLNIGVFLKIPELSFQKIKVVEGVARLEKVFGEINKSFFNRELLSIEHALINGPNELLKSFNYENFIMRKLEKIRMTNLEVIKIFDPKQDIIDLFDELVTDFKVMRAPRVRKVLSEKLMQAGLDDYLEKPKSVNISFGGERISIDAPFAYQNGDYQLIDAASFVQSTPKARLEAVFAKACEGELLHKEIAPSGSKYKYNVVGKFGDSYDGFFEYAKEEFVKRDCELFRLENPKEIISKIKRAGISS